MTDQERFDKARERERKALAAHEKWFRRLKRAVGAMEKARQKATRARKLMESLDGTTK